MTRSGPLTRRARLSSQVYKRLETLQAAVAGPSPEPEAASRTPSSPQENSYVSTSGALAQATERLQKGTNQPVESDESVSGLSAALRSWHLTPSCPPGPAQPGSLGPGAAVWTPAPLRQAGRTQGASTGQSGWESGPGPQPTVVEGSWGHVPRRGETRGPPGDSPHAPQPWPSERGDLGPALKLPLS